MSRIKETTPTAFLEATHWLYQQVIFPLISRRYPAGADSDGPQRAHERAMQLLGWLDEKQWAQVILHYMHEWLNEPREVEVGGVRLSSPLILAAGWVKGLGYDSYHFVHRDLLVGENMIPGWRTMQHLVPGAIEFGSYTPLPRLGNEGVVMWRDREHQSLQNRVGLKNPGAKGAANFLSAHKDELPKEFGINIAPSPGVDDLAIKKKEVIEAVGSFIEQGVFPLWFTLNISCPNTEDSTERNQVAEEVRELCTEVVTFLQERAELVGREIPLWVKVGPDLTTEQYKDLLQVFNEAGVKAVIATNTQAKPTPNDPTVMAGVSGGRLHYKARYIVLTLARIAEEEGYNLDVIGCGGIQDAETYSDTWDTVKGRQYLSALVFHGPWAGLWMMNQVRRQARKKA